MIEANALCEVWRHFNGNLKQYTWAHTRDNILSLARLERSYREQLFKHYLSIFKNCFVIQAGFPDRSLDIRTITPSSQKEHTGLLIRAAPMYRQYRLLLMLSDNCFSFYNKTWIFFVEIRLIRDLFDASEILGVDIVDFCRRLKSVWWRGTFIKLRVGKLHKRPGLARTLEHYILRCYMVTLRV